MFIFRNGTPPQTPGPSKGLAITHSRSSARGGSTRWVSRPARKLAAALAAGVVVTLASLGAAAPSQASGTSSRLNFDEVVNCYFNAKACAYAKDAQQWAESITRWKFPNEIALNTRADAFRHCTWSAALTQRVGFETAWQILSTHETSASSQPANQLRMDMANNYTGTQIGMKARREGGSDQWGWIMNKCEKLARSGQLETIS